ncbi:MAG: GFA family protein [Rhizobiales bacterium]|nr:GFA family protein [Hyphomicrobiales bacterium]
MTGGCLCGAVRFSAAPAKREVGACHCGMCRRWSAGPFLVLDCERSLEIEDATNLGVYRSSEWAERCFCKQCGTPLFYRLVEKDFYAVSAEAFDDRDGYEFKSQIFIDEKPAYYDFANKTATMTGAEVFAAFALPADRQAKE